jgi:serine/threonine protein kinase
VYHGLTENAFTTTKSKESDVYSYGVVLLELITKKKALDPSFMEDMDIVGWVRSVWSNAGEIERIVDLSLMDEFLHSDIMEQVIDVLLVALRCTEKEPSKRPTMRDVVRQLLDATTPMRSKKSQPF